MSLWEESLGKWDVFTHGHGSVMLKVRWRCRENLGESNVCEENTCEVTPLLLQICSSLFLWKGECEVAAKWEPKPAVSGCNLAIPLDNFE